MTTEPKDAGAAIGLRVKSGWAAAVLIAGPLDSPQALDRRVIELCDPALPESCQPYHAGMGRLQTDEAKVERLRQAIRRAAEESVQVLLRDYRNASHRISAAGLVVGSEADPARITNPHIRAHALEGCLFRTVLEDALRSCGVPSLVLVEKQAYARSAEVLGQSEADLKRLVTELGRELVGPWRADEKTACLAALLALAGHC
jgi:hypothetical protein